MHRHPLTATGTFAAVEQPPFPADTFCLADMVIAVEKLRENSVPPYVCPACSSQYFFVQTGAGEMPTHWRCTCGRISRTVYWSPGVEMRLAQIVGGFVVLGDLPEPVVKELAALYGARGAVVPL